LAFECLVAIRCWFWRDENWHSLGNAKEPNDVRGDAHVPAATDQVAYGVKAKSRAAETVTKPSSAAVMAMSFAA
jgi:hypothetical protein